jgi:hypothetical protein
MFAERLPNPRIDVELELSRAIASIGGVRVDSVVGKTEQKNADFLFDRFSVIAELKELDVDQIATNSFIKKCSAVYERHRSAGKVALQVFGTVRLSTEGFSEEFRQEIADLYAIPLRRVISSTDAQIESTLRLLERPAHSGVLILVNNGNTALHPHHVIWSLDRHLGGMNYQNINAVVFFTVNMPVKSNAIDLTSLGVRSDMDLHVWYSAGRRGFNRVEGGLLESLREPWFSHLSNISGTVVEIPATSEELQNLKNNVLERD